MPDPDMTTPPDPPPRRTPFEWSLAALRPADADVARPSFMFKAGQASREKAVRFWRWVAGGLAVVMGVGAVAGFGLVSAERERAEALVAQSRAVPQPPTVPPPQVDPPTPDPYPNAVASQTYLPPTVVSTVSVLADEPTPAELAAALERRRNILVGGLGLIPDAPPVFAPDSPRGTPTYPGVLAAPRVEKKPPPAPDPDDLPPP